MDYFGNESDLSYSVKVVPNPPTLGGWPKSLVDLSCAAVLAFDFAPEMPGIEVVIPNKVGEIYAYSSSGELLDGWPVALGEKNEFWGGASAGDLDGDGDFEFAIVPWSDTNCVFAFERDGTPVSGWPVYFEGGGGTGTRGAFGPAVCSDLDGDGVDEVIINTLQGEIYIWHGDGTGFLDSTGFFYDLPDAAWAYSSPAVADIDGDGEKEIVVGSNLSKVYALKLDGTVMDGFPVNVSGGIYTAPILADFDPDIPGLEIAVGTYGNKVYLIDNAGNILSGWPQIVSFSCDICVGLSAGNLDLDPEPELIVHGDDGLYVFNKDGSLVPGFPVVSGGGRSAGIIGDVDQDGEPEIFWNTDDGWLKGVKKDGEELYGFPILTGDDGPSSPLLVDLDQDGLIDLLGTAGAGLFYGFTLMSNYGQMEWPFYKHDIGRTSSYTTPLKISLSLSKIKKSIWQISGPYPSLSNRAIYFSLMVPRKSKGEIKIFDQAGRKIRIIHKGFMERGMHHFQWKGKDDMGRGVPSGVYFLKIKFKKFKKVEKVCWISRTE